jgi:hypothetical protein
MSVAGRDVDLDDDAHAAVQLLEVGRLAVLKDIQAHDRA